MSAFRLHWIPYNLDSSLPDFEISSNSPYLHLIHALSQSIAHDDPHSSVEVDLMEVWLLFVLTFCHYSL